MNTDLHKRLEVAANNYAYITATPIKEKWMEVSDIYRIMRNAHAKGAALGYKEAIKIATEWLNEKVYDGKYWGRDDEGGFLDADEFLTDFETYMNKLWEEKKYDKRI